MPNPSASGGPVYFAPSYFGAVLPGPGIGFASAGGYHAGRYWAAGYFAPPYWASRPVAPTVLPPSLVGAARAALLDHAPLAAKVIGNWWHRQSPPGQSEPVGILVVPSATDDRIGGDYFLQDGVLQLSVYGPRAEASRDLADLAAAVLAGAGPLRWANGRLMYLSRSTPASPMPPAVGPGGASVQGEVRAFKYQAWGVYPS